MNQLDRRQFLKVSLGNGMIVLTSGLFGQQALSLSTVSSTVRGVVLGANTYSLSSLPLDDAIKAMAAIGFGEAELHPNHIEPKTEPREKLRHWRLTVPLDLFAAIARKFQDSGIYLYAYNMNFSDDFTDPEIDRTFEMTKALGCRVMTAVGSNSLFRRLDPFAKKHKLLVGLHNEVAGLRTAEDFDTVRQGLSEYIKIALDIGHFVAAGSDPVSFIDKYHQDIVDLHIKDRKKGGGRNMPFGQGTTPIKDVLLMLRDRKFSIPANIEWEVNGDRVAALRRCFDYCKEILESA
jgi:sugar phosphate isomerase/epimerase